MSRESLIITLGLFVLIVPFLGFPQRWENIALALFGALIMFVGFLLRRAAFLRSIEDDRGERKEETFAEPSAPMTSTIYRREPEVSESM